MARLLLSPCSSDCESAEQHDFQEVLEELVRQRFGEVPGSGLRSGNRHPPRAHLVPTIKTPCFPNASLCVFVLTAIFLCAPKTRHVAATKRICPFGWGVAFIT